MIIQGGQVFTDLVLFLDNLGLFSIDLPDVLVMLVHGFLAGMISIEISMCLYLCVNVNVLQGRDGLLQLVAVISLFSQP